jgi:hypothetical protein
LGIAANYIKMACDDVWEKSGKTYAASPCGGFGAACAREVQPCGRGRAASRRGAAAGGS